MFDALHLNETLNAIPWTFLPLLRFYYILELLVISSFSAAFAMASARALGLNAALS